MVSCTWLLSLTIVFLRLIHDIKHVSIVHPFSLLNSIPLYDMLHIVYGCLCCFFLFFFFFGYVNNADINIYIKAFVSTFVFISLGKIHRRETAESYDSFNSLRNCQTVFQNSLPFHILPAVYENVHFSISLPTFVTAYLTITISLRTNDVNYLLLVICISSSIHHIGFFFD